MRRRRIVALALLSALAVGAVGAGVATLVVSSNEPESAAASTSTSSPSTPSSTTSTTPRREIALVDPAGGGPPLSLGPVEVDPARVAAITAVHQVPIEHPVVLDSEFVAAQNAAGVDLARLRRQLQYLANRFGPAAADPSVSDAVALTPSASEDGAVRVPVLVYNADPVERTLAHLDLELVTPSGASVTETARFFEDRDLAVAPGSWYFNVLAFSPDQVVADFGAEAVDRLTGVPRPAWE